MSKLLERQIEFSNNLPKLFDYIHQKGFQFTLGEAFRTVEQQKIYIRQGRSKTMHSKHLQRLAIDLNFFITDDLGQRHLIYDKNLLQDIGDFWESLAPQNRWGGNWHKFKDVPHFQG